VNEINTPSSAPVHHDTGTHYFTETERARKGGSAVPTTTDALYFQVLELRIASTYPDIIVAILSLCGVARAQTHTVVRGEPRREPDVKRHQEHKSHICTLYCMHREKFKFSRADSLFLQLLLRVPSRS
jgi:hypothetical protein